MNKAVFDNVCKVTCTNNDKVVEAEVDNFREKDSMNVFMATNKIHMKWNGMIYVGNAFGFEFTSPGPDSYNVKDGGIR
jgi:hypothetical protein